MKDFKRILLFLILICFYSCAEFQNAYQSAYEKENKTSDFCPKIYGEWEACNTYSQTYPKKKKQIYNFDINGTLTVDGFTLSYRFEQSCSKLFINNESTYTSVELRKDSLFIRSNNDYLSSDPFILILKKIK